MARGMSGKEGAPAAAPPSRSKMAESPATLSQAGAVNGAATQEYRLAAKVTPRDVDQEVGLTLVGLGCTFERCEVGGAVTYLLRRGSAELGRLVIVPPTRVFPYVRLREVHFCPEFEALCQSIRRDLGVLSRTAEQAGAREGARFSYPRPQRRQIVAEYRTARRNGEVENKETWAQNRYHICRKTLWRYECEFPEESWASSDTSRGD